METKNCSTTRHSEQLTDCLHYVLRISAPLIVIVLQVTQDRTMPSESGINN